MRIPASSNSVRLKVVIDFLSLLLAVIGLALFLFGAFFAIAAPGDGQTGMFVFPAWIVGIPLGIAGFVLSFRAEFKTVKIMVWSAVAIAFVAFGWSIWASYN